MKNISVGIVGAAGYTGGELIRILLQHPSAQVLSVQSNSQAGKPVTETHTDLLGFCDLVFTKEIDPNLDVIFLCLPHGESSIYLKQTSLSPKTKVIDLSNDHRLKPNNNGFVYGLPELNYNSIALAQYIANPGCFATAIQLALLPLSANNHITDAIHVSAITGSTGAGQGMSPTVHFTWRQANLSVYKAFTHQHLAEISQSIVQLQPQNKPIINFIPYRGDFTRGIFASVYTTTDLTEADAHKLYVDYYEKHPFTIVSKNEIHLKQVVNTNKCLLNVSKHGNQLLITSAIDNLIKGASGQAIQNMNIICGLDQTTGLLLKPSAY